jgi:hypothetical protein
MAIFLQENWHKPPAGIKKRVFSENLKTLIMKKHVLPLLGGMLILFSCAKQDAAPVANETGDDQPVTAQRFCAANEVLEKQIAENPARAKALEDLERFTESYKGREARGAGILYVPVVVHVVHTNPNIVTSAQIQSQIDVLNRDFGKTNIELGNPNVYLANYPLSSVANCQVVFYLASTVRQSTNLASFGTNDAVKKTAQGGSNPVDPTTKLNIWVCNLSSGLLGYAQFPGGSSATDGVVIDYQAFGTVSTGYSLYAQFDLGRTATHEIGHWFNLRHIWGDARCGNDLVSDTPLHDASNGGCPAQGSKSRCSGKPLEQWMNYMDYTDDACMYMFSAGQKTRMDAAIDGSRAAYVSATAPTP